jgi:hypothetical protein
MDKRIGLAAGAGGLWLGLLLALVGRVGVAEIGGGGYVVGLVAGGLLAFGIAKLVEGR